MYSYRHQNTILVPTHTSLSCTSVHTRVQRALTAAARGAWKPLTLAGNQHKCTGAKESTPPVLKRGFHRLPWPPANEGRTGGQMLRVRACTRWGPSQGNPALLWLPSTAIQRIGGQATSSGLASPHTSHTSFSLDPQFGSWLCVKYVPGTSESIHLLKRAPLGIATGSTHTPLPLKQFLEPDWRVRLEIRHGTSKKIMTHHQLSRFLLAVGDEGSGSGELTVDTKGKIPSLSGSCLRTRNKTWV